MRSDNDAPLYRREVGKVYRVGYRACEFDTDCTVWLVDEHGEYVDTADLDMISKYFRIERLSRENDFEGLRRAPLGKNPRQQEPGRRFPPPGTTLRLYRACKRLGLDREQVGGIFQVDYYDPERGLETVWIANRRGDEIGVIPRSSLLRHFRILKLPTTADFTGLMRLQRLNRRGQPETARPQGGTPAAVDGYPVGDESILRVKPGRD